MTHDEIQNRWAELGKQSRDAGTMLHDNIDKFYKTGATPQDENTPEWRQFKKFREDHPDWVCIGNEYQVYNEKAAGTIDAIFSTPKGIVLVDWKRTKALDFSGYGMGRGCMRHVADCNYSKYSLQLSLYRELCQFSIVDCYIVQLHPDLECYQKVKAQHFDIEARNLLY
jgi:ATP-dependent exoDNAse (exonuclease V) beta subunit